MSGRIKGTLISSFPNQHYSGLEDFLGLGNLFPEKKALLPALVISDHSLYAESETFPQYLFLVS